MVLKGHTARLWDCAVHADHVATASEDSTCRWVSTLNVCKHIAARIRSLYMARSMNV